MDPGGTEALRQDGTSEGGGTDQAEGRGRGTAPTEGGGGRSVGPLLPQQRGGAFSPGGGREAGSWPGCLYNWKCVSWGTVT